MFYWIFFFLTPLPRPALSLDFMKLTVTIHGYKVTVTEEQVENSKQALLSCDSSVTGCDLE